MQSLHCRKTVYSCRETYEDEETTDEGESVVCSWYLLSWTILFRPETMGQECTTGLLCIVCRQLSWRWPSPWLVHVGLYLGDVIVGISELPLKFSHQQCVYSVFKSHLFNCKEEWQLAWTFGQQVRRISFNKGLSFERTTPWINWNEWECVVAVLTTCFWKQE